MKGYDKKMKTYGIICEYNPFHNGHIYQIEKTKELTGADHIVAIMSGNFVQRGEPAIVDKFARAQIAVRNGVDLVIELPVQYSLASAEMFARSGLMMLGALRCVEGISFGAETDDLDALKKCADAVIELSTVENLRPLMEQGMPYPAAIQQLVALKYGPALSDILNTPNNILAVEYLKAIKLLNLEDQIKPCVIKREGADHDSDVPSGNIASGEHIRRLIDDGEDFSPFVPEDTFKCINEYDDHDLLCWFENYERVILYRLRTMSPQEMFNAPDVDQGLANRMFQASRSCNSLEDLLEKIKTRAYTMARIKRIIFNMLSGIRKDDLKVPPVYGRILALNDRGTDVLKLAGSLPENKMSIPFSSSLKDFLNQENKNAMRSVGMTTTSSDVYVLGSRNIRPSGLDFTTPIYFNKIEGFVSELPADLKTTAHAGTPEEVAAAREADRLEHERKLAENGGISMTTGGADTAEELKEEAPTEE
ncbi:MAG: nucleotidyltransferase family protein [Oscillospiraceae bacterium]|nr:nucleotidyltransferase family protein [Oscillospiraceae bacterium]